MPIVADAAVKVAADMAAFNQDLKRGGEEGTRTLGQQLKNVFSPKNLAVAGVAGGVALAGAITAGLAGAVKSLIDIERLNAQTDAAIRSTGGAANVTREDIEQMGEALEKTTTIEREAVQEAANLLLTFTHIRNEAGEGSDIFDQTTEAVLDMSVAMGTDARTSAMQLGKALNDPIKGMEGLARSGVQFTDAQKDMVAALVESGDLLGAQKVILKELETQFGGSAEAFANTTAGKIARFQNDIGNMFESIILGAVKVSDTLGTTVDINAMHFGDMGDRANKLADGLGITFDELKKDVQRHMEQTGDSFDETLVHIEEFSNQGMVEADRYVSYLESRLPSGTESAVDGMADEMGEAPGKMADELLANQFHLDSAIEELINFMAQALTPAQEIFNAQMFLASEEAAAGLASGNPLVVQKTEEMVAAAEAVLEAFDAYGPGFKVGTSFAAGMDAAYGYVRTAAGGLARAARGQIGIDSEPKDHDSPLRGITKWGGNIVKTIAEGIYGELGVGSNAAAALAGALVPGMSVPSMALAGAGATPAGGITYQLVISGVPKNFNSEQDMLDALKDLSAFGEGRLS